MKRDTIESVLSVMRRYGYVSDATSGRTSAMAVAKHTRETGVSGTLKAYVIFSKGNVTYYTVIRGGHVRVTRKRFYATLHPSWKPGSLIHYS